MWLLTTCGFYSIVQKDADINDGMLTCWRAMKVE